MKELLQEKRGLLNEYKYLMDKTYIPNRIELLRKRHLRIEEIDLLIAKRKWEEKGKTGFASVDLPWLDKYEKDADKSIKPKMSMFDYIYEKNKDYKSQPALEYYGRKITFDELFNKTLETEKSLRALGVKKGDIFTICSMTTPETVYLQYAASKIGAVANFVNPFVGEVAMKEIINETKSKVTFVMQNFLDIYKKAIDESNSLHNVVISPYDSLPLGINYVAKAKEFIEKSKTKKGIIPDNEKWSKYQSYIKVGHSYIGKIDNGYEEGKPSIMVYSSGSTGKPKGILLTSDGFNAMCQMHEDAKMSLYRHKKFLQLVPQFYSTGACNSLHLPLSFGITTILEPVFSQEKFASYIVKYQPNYTIVATSQWENMINNKVLDGKNVDCLIYPIAGGEMLPIPTEEVLNDTLESHGAKAKMLKGYGACEFGACLTFTREMYNVPGSVGVPLPGVKMAIFDVKTDEELKYYEVGKIKAQTPSRMTEYFHNEEETKKRFPSEWGDTGDLGYMDEEGQVFILGRENDSYQDKDGTILYNCFAKNIILQNPKIQACEVVVKELNGEKVPVAHVIIKKEFLIDAEYILEELDLNCHVKLTDKRNIPYAYKIREMFKAAPSGKRDMNSLREEDKGFVRIVDGKMVDLNFDNKKERVLLK